MDTYVKNVKLFFTAGGKSFLTKGVVKGDDETFYFHCLHFYIPKIAKETFEENHLGVGVFTMQGYERRNKETKRQKKCTTATRMGRVVFLNRH